MNEISFLAALLLAIWGYLSISEYIFTHLGFWHRPLVAGVVAGFIVGDLTAGIVVGATLEMASLGVHSYGGAVVPDFTTGSILGVVFAYTSGNIELGIALGIPLALLGSYLDVIARTSAVITNHKADSFAAKGDIKGIWRWHLIGSSFWGLSRAVPIFLGSYFGADYAESLVEAMPQWFMNGMNAAGSVMPALGVSILLSFLPLGKQWYFAILGFILFAYLEIPMVGVGLLALVIAITYTNLYFKGEDNGTDDTDGKTEQVGGDF